MTFSENVQAGSGNILIKKTSDDTTFETVPVGSTTISGTTVTINPSSDFANSTGYYVTLAS